MTALLGGLGPATFLRRHWQKRPLLVRQALPGFRGFLGRDDLLALAARDDASSRLILRHPRRWERHDGPFLSLDAGMLPARRWTLLVHGVESLVPGGWELLRRFAFLPAARIDDLMVSYAADGGSVGPHDDRYDVFLLQGPGRRRWQIQHAGDRTPDPRAAIKVLARFRPDEEWLLEPGDMLYLPPGVAHHGVAEGPCLTYSIGFLAPSHAELVQGFLGYLGAGADPDALYADPDLRPAADPLALGDAMVDQVAALLARSVRFGRAQIADFLGRFLTLPRPRHRFPAPRRPLDLDAFARRLRAPGRLTLALPTRGLVRGRRLFLNGESHAADPLLRRLLDERSLSLPARLPAELVHRWYVAGYVAIASTSGGRSTPTSPSRRSVARSS